MKPKILGLLAASLLVTQSALAALIIDTGTPGPAEQSSSIRNSEQPDGWYPAWRAGKFELTDSYSLTGFAAWTAVQIQGQIRWAIYSDAGNPPDQFGYIGDLGGLLWSVESLSPASTRDPAWVGVDGFALELAAGTYWLALEVPIGQPTFLLRPISPPPNPLLAEAGTFFAGRWPEIGWNLSGSNYGYRIFGDLLDTPPPVPEPGTLALLGLGLAGLGLSRRRKS